MFNINTIYHDLNLDFNENRSLKFVRLKQGENGTRKIRLTLSQNGAPITLAGTETVTYSANINNTAVVANAGCIVSNNTQIIIPVTSQLTALAGRGTIDVKIALNSDVIYTATFRLDIEKAVVSSDTPDIVPTSDFITELKEETQTTMANYIRYMLSSVYPEYTRNIYSETIEDISSTLYGDNPYYVISTDNFAPGVDGIIIWKNGSYMIPPAQYSFEEITGNNIKISFHMGGTSFEIGDIVYFTIYKKPTGGSLSYGISTAQTSGTDTAEYGVMTEVEQ